MSRRNTSRITQYQFERKSKFSSLNRPQLTMFRSLAFFWCTIPLILLVTTTCEKFCLWTDRLSPVWVVTSSVTAIGAWILQFVLWQLCIGSVGSNNAPGYCPYVYQGEGWGRYPSWEVASPWGAGYAIPTLFILYIIQICFAANVMHRQQRTSFRKSDMRQSWARQMEEATSESALITPPMDGRFTAPVLREYPYTREARTRSQTNSYSYPYSVSETQPLSPFDTTRRDRSNTASSESRDTTTLLSPSSRSRSSSTASATTNAPPPPSSRPSSLHPSLPSTDIANNNNTNRRSRSSTVSSLSKTRYYSDIINPTISDHESPPPLPEKTYPANEEIASERRASRSNLNLTAVVKERVPSLPSVTNLASLGRK